LRAVKVAAVDWVLVAWVIAQLSSFAMCSKSCARLALSIYPVNHTRFF